MQSNHTLSGTIESIVYRNEENGYTVAKLGVEGELYSHTIVGVLPGVEIGMPLRCLGEWKEDKRFGPQFKVLRFELVLPTDPKSIERYLGSGLVAGLGPTYAKRIVAKFGVDTLKIFDQQPQLILQVEGIGKKKWEKIMESWKEQGQIRSLMLFLHDYEISPTFAAKIFRLYGDESVDKIKRNPYQLANDIEGIGFKKADEIAQKLGMQADSLPRIKSGILFFLTQWAYSDGHTCYPLSNAVQAFGKELKVGSSLVEEGLRALMKERRIFIQDFQEKGEFIWLSSLYYAEKNILSGLERLMAFEDVVQAKVVNLSAIALGLKIELATEQQQALEEAWRNKVQIITGGPGTGKSTITKVLVKAFEQEQIKFHLAAPTGRAAKRLSEITGREAQTLHSLLEYSFVSEGFRRNAGNPLEAEVVLVDEAGMLDTYLFNGLLEALPDKAKLILVGDVDQLPSVGPGLVLRDLIQGGKIAVQELKQIFRQALHSKIVTSAHYLNQGIMPQFENQRQDDCFFLEHSEPEEITDKLCELVQQRLPKAYGFDPLRDIQVLSPMNKGDLGTQALNRRLQGLFAPAQAKSLQRGEQIWKVGDKVMQTRNNYNKGVYNGDIGFIHSIDKEDQSLVVRMEDRLIDYTFNELVDLDLAYAITIHKFQGSESPCVVLPIHGSHFVMLYKNLIYTGLTRGKRLVIFVGTRHAMELAMRNDQSSRRHTGLNLLNGSRGFPPIVILPPLGSKEAALWPAMPL